MDRKFSIFINLPMFQTEVDVLAAEVGNPSFMPHVTLAGHIHTTEVEALDLTSQIAAAAEPINLSFKGFGTEHREFRFFCIMIQPSAELANLYEIVRGTIPEIANETFAMWPHASLLYGTAAAVAAYTSIESLKIRFQETIDGPQEAKEIALWDTSGPVMGWKMIESFKLGAA